MATYKSLLLSGLEKEPGCPRVFATTGTRKPTGYSSAPSQMEQHSLLDRRLWDLAPSQMEQTVLNFMFDIQVLKYTFCFLLKLLLEGLETTDTKCGEYRAWSWRSPSVLSLGRAQRTANTTPSPTTLARTVSPTTAVSSLTARSIRTPSARSPTTTSTPAVSRIV